MASKSSSTSRGHHSPERLVQRLNPSEPSSKVVAALTAIRTNFLTGSTVDPALRPFIDNGVLLKKLFLLLERPNSKIVDVGLSILGNLCLESDVRRKIHDRSLRALPILVTILTTISEEAIICRASRVVANLAQDATLAYRLHQSNALNVLVKVEEDVTTDKSRQVIVRAIR